MKEKAPRVRDLSLDGKAVLVRGDFDVEDGNNPRADSVREIVRYLQSAGVSKIRVIGHCETDYDLAGQLTEEFSGVEFDSKLRHDSGEKENSEEYARQLASGWEVYINEAFATSHRQHASIMSLPKIIKEAGGQAALGLRFEKEIEMLSLVWDRPGKRVLVIGGTKIEDKQRFAETMKDHFTDILRGGLLPGVELRPDGLDISERLIEEYTGKISEAEVILAAGVMGKYEDPGAVRGTKAVLEAIANSRAYKVAGGGDIEAAISSFNLSEKFDWISVGGGAMLEYLGTGTLPGIQALLE